jgi:YKOF-related Family.
MEISAQISLYPLKQERLSPAIEEAWRIIEKYDIIIQKGLMSTVLTGDRKEVFDAVTEIFEELYKKEMLVLNVTFSNACPV